MLHSRLILPVMAAGLIALGCSFVGPAIAFTLNPEELDGLLNGAKTLERDSGGIAHALEGGAGDLGKDAGVATKPVRPRVMGEPQPDLPGLGDLSKPDAAVGDLPPLDRTYSGPPSADPAGYGNAKGVAPETGVAGYDEVPPLDGPEGYDKVPPLDAGYDKPSAPLDGGYDKPGPPGDLGYDKPPPPELNAYDKVPPELNAKEPAQKPSFLKRNRATIAKLGALGLAIAVPLGINELAASGAFD